jgi:hypothetical protein
VLLNYAAARHRVNLLSAGCVLDTWHLSLSFELVFEL